MRNIMDIAMWIIVAAIIVLVVTHASGAAQAISSIGNIVTHETSILTGH